MVQRYSYVFCLKYLGIIIACYRVYPHLFLHVLSVNVCIFCAELEGI